MYHINNDPRSLKSAKMLYDGLVQLTKEKPLHSITVTDLVDASNVGRTTFYRHFDEIEDVLHFHCDQVCEGLLTYLINLVENNNSVKYPVVLRPVLRYFDSHSEIIEVLINTKRLDILHNSMSKTWTPIKARATQRFGIHEDHINYIQAIRISTIVGILVEWIKSGKQQTPDELADTLIDIISELISLDQLL